MNVLVVGASGATGSLVAAQLLENRIAVRMIVRKNAYLSHVLKENPLVEMVGGDIDTFSQSQMQELIKDCDAVVCCLGHRTTMRGIFGKPYRLVFHAVQKITTAMEMLACKQKFILMSTTAYTNTNDGEKNTFGESVVLSLFKVLLPPHRDNMLAAEQLVQYVGEREAFSWVAVRPDTLVDEEKSSAYEVVEHPKQSPVFNALKTSRINVASFMTDLLLDETLWQQWKFKTPIIYNTDDSASHQV